MFMYVIYNKTSMILFKKIKRDLRRSYQFNASLAFEKFYETKGVDEDAFYFNLIEEELIRSDSNALVKINKNVSHMIYRIVTIVWFSLYFVAANIGKLLK